MNTSIIQPDGGLPGHRLAHRMANWAAGLDRSSDTLTWALLRLDDHVRTEVRQDLRVLHAHAQRMRNTVVPALTVRQVLEFDALLDDPAWRDPEARFHQFNEVYLTLRQGECPGQAA